MARVKATGSNGPAKVQFIEPMYALAVQKLPNGPEWLYEVKFDGYRCLAGRDKKGVTLWSRRGNLCICHESRFYSILTSSRQSVINFDSHTYADFKQALIE